MTSDKPGDPLISINEPNTPSHIALTPQSINEPLTSEDLPVPVLTAIDPSSAAIGSPDFVMTVNGSDFLPASVVTFNGGDEATTFVSENQLETTVRPSLATVAGAYPVTVRNGPNQSAPQTFTFTEAAAPEEEGEDPDELEEEIEEAEDEGEITRHRGKPTTTRSNKRSKAKR